MRPPHSCGMEMDKLQILQPRATSIAKRHSVASVIPEIRSNPPTFTDTSCGQDYSLGLEYHEPTIFPPVSECPCDTAPVHQQPGSRAFHIDVEAHLHPAILQSANHLQPRAVAHVAIAVQRMTTNSHPHK